MKNKQTYINLISNLIAFSVTFLINFLMTPYIVKELGKEAYSFYPLTNNFIMYANLLVIALNSMAGRSITISLVKNEKNKIQEYFSSVLWGNLIIIVLIAIPMYIFMVYIEYFINVPYEIIFQVKGMFILSFLAFLIQVGTSVYGVSTFAHNRIDLNAKKDIIVNLIKALTLTLLLLLFKPSLISIGISTLTVAIVSSVIMRSFFKKLMPSINFSIKHFKINIVKELTMTGLWNSLNHLSNIMLLGLNLLIANIILGATEAGKLSIAQIVPNFINSLLYIVLSVFVPLLISNYAKKDKEQLINNLQFTNKTLALIVFIPLSFFIIFGQPLYELWIIGEDSQELYTLTLIMLMPIAITINVNSLFNLNTVLNKLKVPTFVYFISSVLNVLLVIILLNKTSLGLIAIPMVNIITIVIRDIIFTPLYAAYILEMKWRTFYIPLFKGIVTFILTVILLKFITYNFNPKTWLELLVGLIITLFVSISCSITLLINKSEKKNIFKVMKSKFKLEIF